MDLLLILDFCIELCGQLSSHFHMREPSVHQLGRLGDIHRRRCNVEQVHILFPLRSIIVIIFIVLPFQGVFAPLALSALGYVLLHPSQELTLLEKATISFEFLNIDG
jgi:hypothetical protein